MELYQLRAFVATAEAGQLTRAAARLHVSQPALSAQIKALEADLEHALFERTPSGMRLTRMGEALLPLAQQVLGAADQLKRAASGHRAQIAGRVRLGTVGDPHFMRLGEFLASALDRYPLIEIEVRNEFTSAALEEVRSGAIDASLYFGDITHSEIEGLRLGEIAYRIAAPTAWTDRTRDGQWSRIAELPWIIGPESSTHRRLVESLLNEHGVTPARIVGADNEGVILNLVESEVGLSLVREDVAADRVRDRAIVLWPDVRIVTALWFIYRGDRKNEPVLAALIEVLRETWDVALERGVSLPVSVSARVRPAVGPKV